MDRETACGPTLGLTSACRRPPGPPAGSAGTGCARAGARVRDGDGTLLRPGGPGRSDSLGTSENRAEE